MFICMYSSIHKYKNRVKDNVDKHYPISHNNMTLENLKKMYIHKKTDNVIIIQIQAVIRST